MYIQFSKLSTVILVKIILVIAVGSLMRFRDPYSLLGLAVINGRFPHTRQWVFINDP